MGCLIVFIGLISPRLAIICLWIFTDRLSVAFSNFMLPLLGFLLLPITTLVYALVYDPVEGVSIFGWLLVSAAVFLDLGAYTSTRRRGRRGRRYYSY